MYNNLNGKYGAFNGYIDYRASAEIKKEPLCARKYAVKKTENYAFSHLEAGIIGAIFGIAFTVMMFMLK